MDIFSVLPSELRLEILEHTTQQSDIDNTIRASPAMLRTSIQFPLAIRRQCLRTNFPGSLLYTAKAVVVIHGLMTGMASWSPQDKEAFFSRIYSQQEKLPYCFDRLDADIVGRLEKLYDDICLNVDVMLGPLRPVIKISVDRVSASLSYEHFQKPKDNRLEAMPNKLRVVHVRDLLTLELSTLKLWSLSILREIKTTTDS
ncbi:hypothetical protein CDD81_6525 [Ophiocordyceps australis]|uniref:Uncharacterized protein n=1 Tax=Ophiocordyceps australis TaxID=1399860 RepID=A0A2C5XLY1_9HYPO|nr:hypothetical protein CDD81_6525 [Ophiocordyceps australis]